MGKRSHIDFGSGLYGVAELARYVALQSPDQPVMSRVPYWLRHAITPPPHAHRRPDYGFLDLISLFVVRDLVAAGLRLRQIRTAERYLATQLGHAQPFATERLFTDGGNVFFEAAPRVAAQITAADLGGQEAMRGSLRISLTGVGYKSGVASWWSPRPEVLLDPSVQFGEPCVAGTRLQTRQLWEHAERGETAESLAAAYEVPEESIESALHFERDLAAV